MAKRPTPAKRPAPKTSSDPVAASEPAPKPARDAARTLDRVAGKSPARAKPKRVTGADDRRIRDFAREAARLAHDSHCAEIVLFDVRGLSDITDYILIASGSSDRQIRSVGQEIEVLARDSRLTRMGRDADGRSSWVVLDFVDVVVHLFDVVARAHYDLEMMWGDAPKVRWQRKAGEPKPGAAGRTGDAAPASDDAQDDGDEEA